MTSMRTLHPQIGDSLEAWDHKFTWTSEHRNADEYRPLKFSYDKASDECLEILTSGSWIKTGDDLYAALRDRHHSQERLHRFWENVTTIPEWVDWESIARGQEVFYRYGPAMVTGLAYQALLGGTGGSATVAEILSKTGGFDIERVRKRLLETTQFVLQCTESPEAMKPGGQGFAAAVRVRLLHSTVRKRILTLAATRPSYFSVDRSGMPINDADSIATIGLFSTVMIWISLPRQGLRMRPQEVSDYLALWRLVAFYMGTPTDHFATPSGAKAILESMLLCEYSPSPTSCRVARNIIRGIENRPPFYLSRGMLETQCRWLNGNTLCDDLGIGHPSYIYKVLSAGQFLVFMLVVSVTRAVPACDRWVISMFRRTLWTTVLDPRKGGLGALSLFTFQYIPSQGKNVGAENDVSEQLPAVYWTGDRVAYSLLGLVVVVFVTLILAAMRLLAVMVDL